MDDAQRPRFGGISSIVSLGWSLEMRRRPTLAWFGMLLAVALIAAGCFGATNKAGGASAQVNDGGQVKVTVNWRGASAGPVFDVAIDTHSVDLDGLDLRSLAVLRTGDGREAIPHAWDAPKGGHHREGSLVFPATSADGRPLIGPDTKSIELIIRDIAGIPERRFTWRL